MKIVMILRPLKMILANHPLLQSKIQKQNGLQIWMVIYGPDDVTSNVTYLDEDL